MNLLRQILPLSLMMLSGQLVAAEPYEQNIEDEIEIQQLSSIPLLQSLQNVDTQQSYNTPHIQELDHAKSIRSLFIQSHALPMVDLQLTFNAGSARDQEIAPGLAGLATMAAKLINEGTSRYNANEIASKFEDLGAQMSVQSQRDMFIIRLRALSDPKKLNEAVNLLIHVINEAEFKAKSIENSNKNTQIGQKQLQENPSKLMGVRFYRTIYGQHPYAEPVTGTVASNKKITPEYLKHFRQLFLVTQNMNIAITGDLTEIQAQQLVNTLSNKLPQGHKAKALAEPEAKQGLHIIHMPSNANQASVLMGHLALNRDHPDRLTLELANRMLGNSSFNSLLMQELRVKRGLTYSASSGFSFSQAKGVFSLNYATRQDQLDESLQVAHQTLVNFVQQPIDAQILAETKKGMLLALPNNFSSNAAMNGLLGSMGFYNMPRDYLETYAAKLSAIQLNDVQRAVREHIQPENLTVIVASQQLDSAKLRTQFEQNLTVGKP
jgi:zinc protease